MQTETRLERTWGQAMDRATTRLRTAGIEGARRDARLLLAAVLGVDAAQVMAYPERAMSAAQMADYEGAITRRAGHEPVSRILGRREFWGLDFLVTPDTLDPRPDSETLVAAVLERLAGRAAPLRILDLGTGSGCLLLALLAELREAEGLGVDLDPAALAVARENAARLGLAGRARFAAGDWAEGLAGAWQAIVSNPPYIIGPEIEELSPEVAGFDPRLALDAGPDGLNSYRKIIPQATDILAPEGVLVLEIGAGQGDAVGRILSQSGLAAIERLRDLSGTERCLVARPG
jgi:release factor glutamine methyltransferase